MAKFCARLTTLFATCVGYIFFISENIKLITRWNFIHKFCKQRNDKKLWWNRFRNKAFHFLWLSVALKKNSFIIQFDWCDNLFQFLIGCYIEIVGSFIGRRFHPDFYLSTIALSSWLTRSWIRCHLRLAFMGIVFRFARFKKDKIE